MSKYHEPWELYKFAAGECCEIRGTAPEDKRPYAIVCDICLEDDDKESSEEVRRLWQRAVACVNACKGINPGSIKQLFALAYLVRHCRDGDWLDSETAIRHHAEVALALAEETDE